MIVVKDLTYSVSHRVILDRIHFTIPKGSFVGLLGENGSGKTTLCDLLMGFKKPASGSIEIMGESPQLDHFQARSKIAYLSEKVDLPGDWSIQDVLEFHSFFYPNYDRQSERHFSEIFKLKPNQRVGNLSAGEIRRAQIVAALSAKPELILIDEITAVLDIIGRHRLMQTLKELHKNSNCTLVMATNILEELPETLSHLLLIKAGKCSDLIPMSDFIRNRNAIDFSKIVAERLEEPA